MGCEFHSDLPIQRYISLLAARTRRPGAKEVTPLRDSEDPSVRYQ